MFDSQEYRQDRPQGLKKKNKNKAWSQRNAMALQPELIL